MPVSRLPASPLSVPYGPEPAAVHVLALGGAHQFAHILPVACELERRHPGGVTVFVCSQDEARAVAAQAHASGAGSLDIVVMTLPGGMLIPPTLHKIARLAIWSRRLCSARAILCAERTSTLLKRLRRDCPPMLHIPHGAGDRAVGFEKRFALFAHVLLAGNKDRDRLVESGVVALRDCTVTGPIKLSSVVAAGLDRPSLFDNDRPTILYNPHFSKKLSSIAAFGRRLIETVAADGRYNLVVAPHVRLGRMWSARQRRAWEALAVPGRIIVDLGSARCSDMTYTLGADLYVGDVSSQVYEFLLRPRPCLFVDAHGVDWRDSADYAMWHLGDVISPRQNPVAAIEAAMAGHGAYAGRQRERMAYAIDGLSWRADGTPSFGGRSPASAAADQVERFAGLKVRETPLGVAA